jgi:DNA repair photolyase
MPLLPYITDTDEELDKMCNTFKDAGACYIMPASLTLFGSYPADSKSLMFRAIEKHFPDKVNQYHQLFDRYNIDFIYQKEINKRFLKHLHYHGIADRII